MNTHDYDDLEQKAFWARMNTSDGDYGAPFKLPTFGLFGGGGSDQPELCQGAGSLNGTDPESESVKELQGLLGIKVDGSFGGGTATAVENYQILHNLTATGCADSATWAKLGKTKTPEQQAATAQGISAGFGLATDILGSFGGKKGKKGKKGGGGGASTAIAPAPPNYLLWVGVPLTLVIIIGVGRALTGNKDK